MFLKRYNTVIKNFTYLSILNGLNILLPLLVIPYLTNVIGTAHFGVYSYILGLVLNINIVTQYGFQFSSTRTISQNREDKSFIEQYSSNILCVRFLVATVCVLLVLSLSYWALDTSDRFFMFLTAMGMIYGDVFVPIWLFQGLEKMKFVTIVNASSKILFTILIFIFVKESEDYVYVLIPNSLGYLLAACISMFLVRKQFHFRLRKPQFKSVLTELRKGLALALSMVGIDAYRNINVIILNFFVSDAAVGIYALAEKIIKAAQSFITPVSQALFPHVSLKLKREGLKNSMGLLRNASLCILALTICISLCIYFCGDGIISLIGKDFSQIRPLMTLMYPVLIFGCLNFLLGFVGLINLGDQKFFFYSVFLSGSLSILLLFVFARYWGITVAACTMTLSEIILFVACVCRLMYLYRRDVAEEGQV